MIKRLLLFNRARQLIEDIIIGTTWGGVWGLLLHSAWEHLPSLIGVTSGVASYFTTSLAFVVIGVVSGFLFSLRATLIYGGRSGIFPDRKIYGETAQLISVTVAVSTSILLGALLFGLFGVVIGAAIGLLVGNVGFLLSILCTGPVALAVGAILYLPFTVLWYFWRQSVLSPGQREALKHYDIAVGLDEAKRLHNAIAEYREAISLAPEFAEAFLNLGVDYGLVGDLTEEVAHYEKAVALWPDYAKAVQNLSIAYVEQGYESKARAILDSKDGLLSRRQLNELRRQLEAFIEQQKRV